MSNFFQSLCLFFMLEPKLDVLILGIGDKGPTPNFSMRIINLMKKYQTNIEVLPTQAACGNFNFLNTEHRNVACGLIPPSSGYCDELDLMRAKRRQAILNKNQEYDEDGQNE